MDKSHNGEVWESGSGLRFIVQWVDGDKYGLLSSPYRTVSGATAMMFAHEQDGTWLYTAGALDDRLKTIGAIRIRRHVALIPDESEWDIRAE